MQGRGPPGLGIVGGLLLAVGRRGGERVEGRHRKGHQNIQVQALPGDNAIQSFNDQLIIMISKHN